jgi:hypothetical protein
MALIVVDQALQAVGVQNADMTLFDFDRAVFDKL